MSNVSRDFKGIWIPSNVWLDKRLTYFERCLLAEIHSLDGEVGCYASNEYLCEFFQERERKIQEGLSKLKQFGYVYQHSFDGRNRVLKTNMNPKNDKSLFNTSGVSKSAPLACRNPHPSHIIYNKEENKEQQQGYAAVSLEKEYSNAKSLNDNVLTQNTSNSSKQKTTENLVNQQDKLVKHNTYYQEVSTSACEPTSKNPKIHECLKKIDIKDEDKVEITSRYSEDVVKNAIAWATSPQITITKGLVQAIKWACQKRPEIPKKAIDKKPSDFMDEEKIYANREYAKKYIKDNWARENIRSNVRDKVDHVRIGNDSLYYKDLKFKELFEHYMRKIS